ncbi:hypothetical protein QJS83_13525 [Bdellovibrio sp. 22V]|uniref:hypothetical protein n=1 Tax=Bdellovibrio sp. 22V TaxID=3044166 RepID=UPI002542C232|nr:hypothetical protein [Bdellovibrio sp. 22V]WII71484.1 hypothetical protein QJS83_13525 [Bdellovibrio sp. 22V]
MRNSLVLFSFLLSFAGEAQDKHASAVLWPQDFKISEKHTVTVYQPQVEAMSDTQIKARSAMRLTEDKKDFYGSFAVNAIALISKDTGTVALKNFQISDLRIPTAKVDLENIRTELEKKLNEKPRLVSYKFLVDNLTNSNVQEKHISTAVRNTPPDFIFVKEPSILIRISGDPVWSPAKGAKEVERIINTSALIMHERGKNEYYLWALNKWFSSGQVLGPYSVAKKGPSSKFVMIKDDLVKGKKVDPLEGKQTDGKPLYPANVTPNIIVTTRPSELLQSMGDPQYAAVEGTSLLFMSNSPNSIFLNTKNQNYYVLVAGRWFRSTTLQGPWDYVRGKELPQDFAKIPVTSPVAEVLVSVPGTPQAKEALVVSQIPQTAQVKRDLKPKEISCDGEKKWQAISGTSLQFASNCNTPIIQLGSSFYAVQNGVWFSSTSAEGPWVVAVAVPSEIYKIPVSSPIYYVTFVKVYGSAEDMVTVGYTPGYHGTFVSADGTIVYGTGYDYTSYISSTQWYPAPTTYGFGVGYGWGYDDGFFMGFAMGSLMYPWGWGYCCYGPTFVNVNVTNTYTQWGKHSVISGPAGRGITTNTVGQTKFYRGNYRDNLYASHEGQVYRKADGGWQRYVGPGSWSNVDKAGVSANLDKIHEGAKEEHLANPPTGRSFNIESRPHLNGGGFRAGGFHGGFRR